MPVKPKSHHRLMVEAHPELKRYDHRTETAAERGYGPRWRKARAWFLRRNALCLYCRRQQRETPATLVDHAPPHLGDMKQFWNQLTWTPACKPCHDYITPTYDGGGGHPIKPRDGVYVPPKPGEVNVK